MFKEALWVAVGGFSVVFLTLYLLALSVKAMSFFIKRTEKRGGK